jgi:hypothetical protein
MDAVGYADVMLDGCWGRIGVWLAVCVDHESKTEAEGVCRVNDNKD